MKIHGIGIDMVDIGRVRTAKYIDRLAEYICTAEEIPSFQSSRNHAQFLASRLAVKEAIIKAFPHRIGYQHIVLTSTDRGLRVHFACEEYNRYTVHISLSHEFTYAVSNAVVCE